MRLLDADFAARLAAETTTLCMCWRLERRDGEVFGATDHDATIEFGGVAYAPAFGLAGAALESTSGLAPGRAAVEGALDADFMSEADLASGVWNGARVDVWRVDWRAPEHRVRVWSGRLSEVARQGGAFTAELVSLKADLERFIGRVYSRGCDASVGDARCGVDLSAPEFHGEGVVTAASGVRVEADGLEAFTSGWFTGGAMTWLTGANVGHASQVARHAGVGAAILTLAAPPSFEVSAGDAFEVTAGCDKAFATCGVKFGNTDAFRGFPLMPGNDVVLAGPSSDRVNDGVRRT